MLIAMSGSLVFSVRFDKESIQDDGTIGKRWRTEATVHCHVRDAGGSGAKGSVTSACALPVSGPYRPGANHRLSRWL